MKPIRWGILGAGRIARLFAQDLRLLPDNELAAVGSRSAEKAQRFAADLQAPRAPQAPQAYGSYEALVADADVDVVYIATPHVFHKEQSLLCLEAGKHILVEKPFTMTAVEAREIVAYAREQNLFCMEAMWMRFVPAMQKAVELLKNGAIGDVRTMSASLGFYNEFDPQHRLFDPALGGGAMLDLGIYPLSLIFQVMGRPSTITSQSIVGASGVDEHTAVLLGFPGGQIATLSTSIRGNGRNDAFIMGTQGSLYLHPPILRPPAFTINRHPAPASKPRQLNPLIARLKGNPFAYRMMQQTRRLIQRMRGGQKTAIATQGHGYSYEAAEVSRCLHQNLLESSTMSLDETIAIMETMDVIREISH